MVLSGLLRSTLCGPGTDFATAFIIFILSMPVFARASYNTANCAELLMELVIYLPYMKDLTSELTMVFSSQHFKS